MIKIRLHGLPDEISAAKEVIKQNFRILSESDPYADRGESKYIRVYIDAEKKQPEAVENEN